MLRCNRAWDKVDSFRSPLGYYIIQNAFSGVLHLTPEFFKMKDFIFIFDNSVWAIAGAYLPRAYLHIQNITKASYDLLRSFMSVLVIIRYLPRNLFGVFYTVTSFFMYYFTIRHDLFTYFWTILGVMNHLLQ